MRWRSCRPRPGSAARWRAAPLRPSRRGDSVKMLTAMRARRAHRGRGAPAPAAVLLAGGEQSDGSAPRRQACLQDLARRVPLYGHGPAALCEDLEALADAPGVRATPPPPTSSPSCGRPLNGVDDPPGGVLHGDAVSQFSSTTCSRSLVSRRSSCTGAPRGDVLKDGDGERHPAVSSRNGRGLDGAIDLTRLKMAITDHLLGLLLASQRPPRLGSDRAATTHLLVAKLKRGRRVSGGVRRYSSTESKRRSAPRRCWRRSPDPKDSYVMAWPSVSKFT